ncbi:MSHA biogenesis protein MshF [Vibrio paucivorans]
MNSERARFVVWLVLILLLVIGFMSQFRKVEQEATDTAFIVASKRILERASNIKQEWILQGHPSELQVAGERLAISQNGWVLPIVNKGQVDCSYWLSVLYPENQEFEPYSTKNNDVDSVKDYTCEYIYAEQKVLRIQLINKKFSVSVKFIT